MFCAKDGVGEGVERTRQHGVEAVGKDTARSALYEGVPFHRFAGDKGVGGDVAVCLDGGNHENKSQGDDGGQVEVQSVAERHRQVEAAVALYRGEVDDAHEPGCDVAYHQSDDDGTHAQVAVGTPVEGDDKQQYRRGKAHMAETAEAAVRLCRGSAAAGCDSYLYQAHSDEGDYDAGYQRRDNLLCVFQHPAYQHLHA